MSFFYELGKYKSLSAASAGGKASNLNNMMALGLPVPNGFVAGTQWTLEQGYCEGSHFDFYLKSHIRNLAAKTKTGWQASGAKGPLVVSVRSGAQRSMPGMMETILNIGLNRGNIEEFVAANNATMEFGLDCYRRLVQMYGSTVHGIPLTAFTNLFQAAEVFYGGWSTNLYEDIIDRYEKIYFDYVGEEFPQNTNEQLLEASNAIFKSWYSDKAEAYRNIEGINISGGTAVTVQQMVFGNLNNRSATGVVFTHNPNTGVKGWYGDYLKKAQGEDVVAGTHKVLPIKDIINDEELKVAGTKLLKLLGNMYKEYKEILDVEFTIQNGELYILQYRVAKRTTAASVRYIIDLCSTAEISAEDATTKLISMMPTVNCGTTDPGDLTKIGKGLGATSGIAVGEIAIGHEAANSAAANGRNYVYVATETAPDDIEQMQKAAGILTAKGGSVSHAVVVARAWDKTCVVGFDKMTVNTDSLTVNGMTYKNGQLIKIDGSTGEIYL